MKKWVAIILIAVLVVVVICLYKYNSYKNEKLQMQKINLEFEHFTDSDILGTSLITLINKAVDFNNQNNVQLDKNKLYIDNETNSIKIDIKFTDSDDIYPMEWIEKSGSDNFIKNYATATFKCVKKEYHEKTKNIKYLLYEQI